MRPQLIETLLIAPDRRIPLLARHMARLDASARALGYRCDAEAVEAELRAAAASVTAAGPHRLRLLLDSEGGRTLQVSPLPPLPSDQSIMLSPEPLDPTEPLLRHKTTYRPWYAQTVSWLAEHPHIFDLVYVNTRGELCEGSRSNIHLKLDDRWYTPPLESGCLPGVQRAALIDAGKVQERVLPVALVREAQAIRLSNALRGWFDVTLRG